MDATGNARLRDRLATASSLALHVCGFLALAFLLRVGEPLSFEPTTTVVTVERLSLNHAPRVAHAPVHPLAQKKAPAVTAQPPPPVTLARVPRPRRVIQRRAGGAPPALPGRKAESAAAVISHGTGIVASAGLTSSVEATPTPEPEPSATPTQAPTAVPSAAPAAAGLGLTNIGPWGAMHAPVLLPATAGGMLRALAVRFHVRVSVDEHGHPTGLRWVVPITDDALRERVATQLLTSSYVPGECDGIACAETYEIKN